MTEKRFTLVKCYNQNWGLVDKSLEDVDQLVLIHTNKSSVLYLVNLLNQLTIENEQLKQSLQNKMESDAYWEQKANERIQELEKENEQLKEIKKRYDEIIVDWNVLKIECDELQKENKQLKDWREQQIKEYTKLKKVCNECKRENEELKEEISNHDEVNKRLQNYNNRKRAENERLHRDWDKLYQLCLDKGFTEDELIKELER